MRMFVFGNPDLPFDSLPLRLLSRLRDTVPDMTFEVLDPNEEWLVPEHMYIIDTVVNLTQPMVVRGLDAFMSAPRMTCHDFDAYANLLFLKKLGKIKDVTVFGLPPDLSEADACTWLKEFIDVEFTKEY